MAHENEIVDLSRRDFLHLNTQDKQSKEVTEVVNTSSNFVYGILIWVWAWYLISEFINKRKQKIKDLETENLEKELKIEKLEHQQNMSEMVISSFQKLNSIFEMWWAIFIETDQNWKIITSNNNITEKLWYEKIEVIWKNIVDLAPEGDIINFEKILYWLKSGIYKNDLFFEVRLENKDNEIIYFEVWLIVSDYDDNISYIFIDITTRRNIEDANIQKNRELEIMNKEEKILRKKAEESYKIQKQILATLGHDIRGWLTLMLSFLDKLSETKLTPEQKDYLNKANKTTYMTINMSDSILDYEKIREWKMELESISFSIWKVLDNVLNIYEKVKEKWLELYVNIDPEASWNFFWDPTRLNQMFLNLLTNAIKFTNTWSISFNAYRSEENIIFEVVDTWIWIKKENISKIFKAYTQETTETTRKSGWTWLWLNITKDLAQLMWWKLELESTYQVWSKFILTIPMKQDSNIALEKDTFKDKNITLISDLNDIQKVIKYSSNYLWNNLQITFDLDILKDKLNTNELILVIWKHENEVYNKYPNATNIYYGWYEVKDNNTIFMPLSFNKFKNLLTDFFINTDTNSEQKEVLKRKEKILIWEDSPEMALLLKRNLEKLWFINVDIHTNKSDIINAFKQTNYDLIFMDNQLENWDLWFEVCSEIRTLEKWSNKRSVIISASWDTQWETIQTYLKSWVNAFYPKPFNFSKLGDLIDHNLNKNKQS